MPTSVPPRVETYRRYPRFKYIVVKLSGKTLKMCEKIARERGERNLGILIAEIVEDWLKTKKKEKKEEK